MVDISHDIEWDQNFEFDQKFQAKLNKNDDDSLSSQPQSDDDDDQSNDANVIKSNNQATKPQIEGADEGADDDNDSIDPNKKRIRRPSNAELIDRVIQQQNDEEEKKEEIETETEQDIDNKRDRDSFYSHEKHIFIVTWGGRPLYTRHGSLSDRHMTSFMGVVSLFPSNVERVNVLTQDSIIAFETMDNVKFIYLLCGPLYFFCVTSSSETMAQIRSSMRYYWLLIVMTLTNVFERTLITSPQFDMRSIFGPTDYMLLSKLVEDTDVSPTYLFHSYYPLEMMKSVRDDIGAIIKRIKRQQSLNKFLYSLLFINGTMITCSQHKKRPLHHEDIILISHFVSYSKSWKQSEAFTPICLPHFEASGFVYCYVSYFDDICIDDEKEICIVILTLDATSFKKCRTLRKCIERNLYEKSLIECIKSSSALYPLKTSTIINKTLNIKLPQIYAFYYNNLRKHQYIAPNPIKLYNTKHGIKTLFRKLQHLHHHIHSTPHHQIYFQRSMNDAAICKFVQNQFEIYIIMNQFVTKEQANNVMNKLLNWINIHLNNLTMNPVNW